LSEISGILNLSRHSEPVEEAATMFILRQAQDACVIFQVPVLVLMSALIVMPVLVF
jgi:hypothetical protein